MTRANSGSGTDQRLSAQQRKPYTLVVGMRSWLFAAFRDLKREGVE